MSITIDDFNYSNETGMEAGKRGDEILAALQKHKIKAVGFVTTKYLDNPKAEAGVYKWASEGHLIGNHTENHWKYTEKEFADYREDILKAEKKLQKFTTFTKIFRAPYLKEGKTKEEADLLEQFLLENNYINGKVTIDASDWYVNMRLVEKLTKGEKVDYQKYKDFYIKHIWQRSLYYSNLAKITIGRDVSHTLLIHHNLTTALFLDDLLTFYKKQGWLLIDAKEAFRDPVFKLRPATIPRGEGLIWALAKEKGNATLRYPAEDSVYEKEEMDKLNL